MTAWNGQPRIVVGVDGSEASLTAVRYAAAEARGRGADLEIAHASPDIVRPVVAGGGAHELTPSSCRGVGLKVLNRARRVAREVTGDAWQITTTLLDGAPSTILGAQARDARLVVLGDERHSAANGTAAGSVLAAVVDTASVPVVVVPHGWVDGATGVVAVGVGDLAGSERLLRKALALAATHNASLRIVHAWELPAPYDELVSARIDPEVWSARVRTQLDRVLDRLTPEFPSVSVEVQLVHGQPAWVLREASRAADLLVIARGGGPEGHGDLGATGRALLREAACPVEVLPLKPSVRAPRPRLALDPVLVG